MKTLNIISGVVAGTIIGTVIGFLIAPDEGSTTRKKITAEADKYADKLFEENPVGKNK